MSARLNPFKRYVRIGMSSVLLQGLIRGVGEYKICFLFSYFNFQKIAVASFISQRLKY